MSSKLLFTPSEVKEERKRLFKLQNEIDPILKKKIDFKDSVCDHDHNTQYCRATLHRQTNAFEGLVFNAYVRCLKWVSDETLSNILRNLADYLEKDYSNNAIHPGHIKKICTMFNSLTEKQKETILQSMHETGSNSKQRKEIFKKLVLSRLYSYEFLKESILNLKEQDATTKSTKED